MASRGRRDRAAATWIAAVTCASLVVSLAAVPATPPPTPVPPSGSPSPFPTVLHTPQRAEAVPTIDAPVALLADLDTGQVLFAKRADERRPIASLTKIMTALIVLSSTQLSDRVVVSPLAAAQAGSELGLRVGERISVGHLLYSLLLQSGNDAATALAEHVGETVGAFVERMNARARRMGLRATRFYSPTGLDDRGYSTARDLLRLTRAADRIDEFRRIVATKTATIPAPAGAARHVQNRNALLWLYAGATGVKTGLTTAAGHCLVASASRDGVRLVAIVLGGRSDAFDDAATLLNHGYAAFRKTQVVTAGERVGVARVGGQPVDALAGRTLVRLVKPDDVASVHVRFRAADRSLERVEAGERVGTVQVVLRGRTLGVIPAVAASSAPSPSSGPAAPGTSIRDALGVLDGLARALFDGFL